MVTVQFQIYMRLNLSPLDTTSFLCDKIYYLDDRPACEQIITLKQIIETLKTCNT